MLARSYCLLALLAMLCASARPAAAIDTSRPDVRDFIDEVAQRDDLSKRQTA